MAVKPIPDGYHSVTPYLILDDATRALEFYKQAFGAVELLRMPAPGGKIGHAEIKIGDSPIMLADENPEMGARSARTIGGSPVSLMVYVEDVDALVAQAVAAVERRIPMPWSGKLRVVVELVPPDDDRLHDIDNTMKALLDALTKARVWEDDSQVKRLEMDIDHAPQKPGWVLVVIEPKL